MVKKLSKYRGSGLVWLAAVIYLGKAGWFFLRNSQFTLFWDWPGHIQKAKVATWPWAGGWDTTFWGGYPTMLYPNLYHLLLKLSILLTGSTSAGAILLTMTLMGLQLIALWILIKKMFGSKSKSLAATTTYLIVAAIMTNTASVLIGSFSGTVFTGGGPAVLGTTALLLLFSTDNWVKRALWLGILFLGHPLTASVALIYLLIVAIQSLLDKDILSFKQGVFSLLTGLLIGLPWIMVKLDPSFDSTAINFGGTIGLLSWILISSLLLLAINNKKMITPIWITVIAAGILSVMPDWGVHLAEKFNLRGIHFFRYQWFLLILFPLIAGPEIQKLSGKIKVKKGHIKL